MDFFLKGGAVKPLPNDSSSDMNSSIINLKEYIITPKENILNLQKKKSEREMDGEKE